MDKRAGMYESRIRYLRRKARRWKCIAFLLTILSIVSILFAVRINAQMNRNNQNYYVLYSEYLDLIEEKETLEDAYYSLYQELIP